MDFKNFKGTRGAARRTTQEELDAARLRAAGGATPKEDYREGGVARYKNPEFAAWAKTEVESRARRLVRGTIESKGRAPGVVLSEGQFAQFRATGQWEGMPTVEEYGPQHAVPDDKEYTKLTGGR